MVNKIASRTVEIVEIIDGTAHLLLNVQTVKFNAGMLILSAGGLDAASLPDCFMAPANQVVMRPISKKSDLNENCTVVDLLTGNQATALKGQDVADVIQKMSDWFPSE